MIHEVILAGERWEIGPVRFTDPLLVIEARDPAEVGETLDRAEAAAQEGHWVVGFVGYQAAPGLDPKLSVPEGGDLSLPLAWFGAYRRPADGPGLATAPASLSGWSALLPPDEHARRVEAIRGSITAGDTYQVNLTFPMTADLDGTPTALFGAMLRAQPASYGFCLDLGGEQVVSVSPELFFRREGRHVTTRPMKGTAPRGRSSAEDLEIRDRLIASEKERSGNVMIVDMVRNDLGRVARSGTVRAERLFEAERHPTLWQLTSTVTADLDDGVGLRKLFGALFPSGSVTGAPKISTMEIISRLEPVERGIYCGAIGYLPPGGETAEFSVAIRTGVVRDGRFTYHVGGGITYDSVASTEYDECWWKALVVTDHRAPPELLETMRYVPGKGIPLLQEHIRRLTDSADYWGLEVDMGRIGDALSAVEGPHESRVRLMLFPDGSVEVTSGPMPEWDEPVPLLVSDVRVDNSDPLWFHKTVDRSRYPETDDDVEAVLVNLDGEVTETNRSNLMAHVEGRWVTPPVTCGCLPGVARARAIASGEVTEAVLTLDDLARADQLAVTNALRGWRKAGLIG